MSIEIQFLGNRTALPMFSSVGHELGIRGFFLPLLFLNALYLYADSRVATLLNSDRSTIEGDSPCTAIRSVSM